MGNGWLLLALGFVLVCRGYFAGTFWYAEEGSTPMVLWNGIRVFPGTLERAAGMVLLVAGMAVIFRSR